MTGCVYKVPAGERPCPRTIDIKSRGLCQHHYQRAYHRHELDDYPRTLQSPEEALRSNVVVRCADTLVDAVAAIVKARRARGLSVRHGASTGAVLRELIQAGLDSGTVT